MVSQVGLWLSCFLPVKCRCAAHYLPCRTTHLAELLPLCFEVTVLIHPTSHFPKLVMTCFWNRLYGGCQHRMDTEKEGLVSALVFLRQEVCYTRTVMVHWRHCWLLVWCVPCEKNDASEYAIAYIYALHSSSYRWDVIVNGETWVHWR